MLSIYIYICLTSILSQIVRLLKSNNQNDSRLNSYYCSCARRCSSRCIICTSFVFGCDRRCSSPRIAPCGHFDVLSAPSVSHTSRKPRFSFLLCLTAEEAGVRIAAGRALACKTAKNQVQALRRVRHLRELRAQPPKK